MNKFLIALLFVSVFLFVAPSISFAATLSITPASGSYTVGSTIPIKVLVSSPNASINAVSGILTFSPSIFSVVSISKKNSILNFWPVAPLASDSSGTAHFEGVDISGFQGRNGTVVTIMLHAKNAGIGKVAFQRGQVLANDGKGNDVTSGLYGATFTIHIAAPVTTNSRTTVQNPKLNLLAHITSVTHPVQTKWYNTSHVILDWTNAQGVTAVRLGYDQNADGKPTVLYTNPISHKELDLQDGIWYFHVQEKGPSGNWGLVSTFRVQIDSVPPLPITLQFPNSATSTSTSIPVYFATTDVLSGISYYQLTIDGKPFIITAQEGSGVYALPTQTPGKHTLLVKAYDKAGNSVSTKGTFTILGTVKKKQPLSLLFFMLGWQAINYLSLIIVALAALSVTAFGGWYLWHHFHSFRRRFPGTNKHLHKVLREQFENLTDSVISEVSALEKARSKRELTREEARVITNLKKIIKKTEFSIENDSDELS